MAFIRNHMARTQLANYQGDPFSLRIPKKLRKLKVGRAVGKLAKMVGPIAAGVLTGGLGAIAAPALAGALSGGGGGGIAQEIEVPQAQPLPYIPDEEPAVPDWLQLMAAYNPEFGAFARSYGYAAGDPKPGGSRRKSAGAGPAVKAKQKATKRAVKAVTPRATVKGSSARGSKKSGPDLGALAGGALNLIGQLKGGPAGLTKKFDFGALAGGLPGIAAGMGKGFGGGSRRTMNPGNVKALRRSLRRVEGFEKLVKRIEKQYPRLKRAVGHSAPAARGRKRCA